MGGVGERRARVGREREDADGCAEGDEVVVFNARGFVWAQWVACTG